MEKQESLTFSTLLLRVLNNCLAHIKLCFLIVALPTITMFVLVMWVIEPTYRATAIVTPPVNDGSSIGKGIGSYMSNSGKTSGGSSGLLGSILSNSGEEDANVVWTIFNSWEIHSQIIDHFDLANHYEFDGKFKADLLKSFRKNFDFENNDENMFAITVEDKDPQMAADIIEFMLDKADSAFNAYKTSQARQSRLYFQQRLDSCEKVLNALLEKFSKFQAENNFYDPEIQMESTIKYLSDLQAKREDLSMEMAYEKDDRGENSKRYDQLSKRYHGINKALSSSLNGKNGDVGIVSLKKSPALSAEYMQYKSEIKVQEALYQMLRIQSEEMQLAEAKMLKNLHVLEPPWPNDKKVYPIRSVMLAFTCLLSGILAIFICCFVEYCKRVDENSVFAQEMNRLMGKFKRKKS